MERESEREDKLENLTTVVVGVANGGVSVKDVYLLERKETGLCADSSAQALSCGFSLSLPLERKGTRRRLQSDSIHPLIIDVSRGGGNWYLR